MRLKSFTIALLSLFLLPNPTKAIQEFETSYKSLYTVEALGNTKVTHEISLKNNLANIYTTNYTISIGSGNITNIIVSDESGEIEPEITKKENTTVVDIIIPNPAIGKDKVKNLKISYTNNDIALKNGRIWEINIPKLSNANEINNYTRILQVPNSFSDPSIQIPNPSSVSKNENSTIYVFNGNNNSSITMFFGDYQIFKLNLKYHIENNSLKPADTEIALPPDTAYQKILIDQLEPKPNYIKLDDDNNWMAVYTLDPSQSLDINTTLYATIHAKPFYKIKNSFNKSLTTPLEYWESENEDIVTLANQLGSTKKIYDYLVENFVYSYDRVYSNSTRLGAVKALDNPSIAICTEFTDTFIALSRALNIPSREINGFAYTNNQELRPLSLERDILHAWPEFLDQESGNWIQIDPTWANTTGGINYYDKLDFNHIAFVIHGQESNYPYPAGAYKIDSSEKQIDIVFSDTIPNEKLDLKHTTEFTSTNPFKTSKIVTITNNGNIAAHSITYTADEDLIDIDYIPPYGSKEFEVSSKLNFNPQALPINLLAIAGLLLVALLVFYKLILKR